LASISLPILRELGLNGLKKNIFPCVSHQHYAISNFFFKIYFSTSYVLHRTFSPIITVLTETSTQVFQSILYIVSKVLGPFCQKSKFTGLYELRLIPKVLEKWISDYLIHPVYTLDLKKSFIQHKKEGFLKKN